MERAGMLEEQRERSWRSGGERASGGIVERVAMTPTYYVLEDLCLMLSCLMHGKVEFP
jgi:hypothetical protein